jgi:patatin-like phospholipase/acyl hydrolase
MYHILTLDGGGIRGLLSAILLERIETALPGTLAQVDLFAGTSTGGILALGLAAGFAPAVARASYEQQGRVVFADSPLDNLRDLGHAIGAQYAAGPLKQTLTRQFGDMRLGDLPRKVLIAAFDLDTGPAGPAQLRSWKPKFFHNYPGPDSDADERVVDVAMRTSAAPSYFPVYQGYVDGGVVAGNPSMAALAQSLEPTTGGQALGNITLLSVGTGRNTRHVAATENDWGWLQWSPHIIDIVLDGNSGVADYQCRQLLGPRYHRLNPLLPERINLDDLGKIPRLAEIASRVSLEPTLDWLRPTAAARSASVFPGWQTAASPLAR